MVFVPDSFGIRSQNIHFNNLNVALWYFCQGQDCNDIKNKNTNSYFAPTHVFLEYYNSNCYV